MEVCKTTSGMMCSSRRLMDYSNRPLSTIEHLSIFHSTLTRFRTSAESRDSVLSDLTSYLLLTSLRSTHSLFHSQTHPFLSLLHSLPSTSLPHLLPPGSKPPYPSSKTRSWSHYISESEQAALLSLYDTALGKNAKIAELRRRLPLNESSTLTSRGGGRYREPRREEFLSGLKGVWDLVRELVGILGEGYGELGGKENPTEEELGGFRRMVVPAVVFLIKMLEGKLLPWMVREWAEAALKDKVYEKRSKGTGPAKAKNNPQTPLSDLPNQLLEWLREISKTAIYARELAELDYTISRILLAVPQPTKDNYNWRGFLREFCKQPEKAKQVIKFIEDRAKNGSEREREV